MEISAVNNVPDIIIRPKLDIVPGNIGQADKQHQNQGLPENQKTIDVSSEQINKAIERANKSLAAHSTKLTFSIHDKTKEIITKVVDTNSGEVIREIPSEKLLDRLAMALEEIGLLVDEKV